MMLALHQKTSICVMTLTLCMVATAIQGELPVNVYPVMIPGTVGECPSDDSRQTSRNLLQNATHEIFRNTLINPTSQIKFCGPGEWRSVFTLNVSSLRSDQSCPDDWRLVTSPVRSCAGADYSCSSAFSDDINAIYSKVCGRVTGSSAGSPDAFFQFLSNQDTIEDTYLEGVSITHGASGSRTHIWSFGAGHPGGNGFAYHCPCANSNRAEAPFPPAEVGENYFCDGAGGLARLWTGENRANDDPCCSFHNPPYFSVQLLAATTDRIEIRICTDET